LSQAEVAHVLGVSRQAVARWETGERRPSGKNLATYVALLDRLAAYFGEEEAPGWTNDF
jgi:DNA-binding transcriptional regulator YiaG